MFGLWGNKDSTPRTPPRDRTPPRTSRFSFDEAQAQRPSEVLAKEVEAEDEIFVEVSTVHRQRLRVTSNVHAYIQKLHELQVQSLPWLEGENGEQGEGDEFDEFDAVDGGVDDHGVVSTCKLRQGSTEASFEVRPLLSTPSLPPTLKPPFGPWPPPPSALVASNAALEGWLKLAVSAKEAKVEAEKEAELQHFSHAAAKGLSTFRSRLTLRQQLQNLPTAVKLQVITAAVLVLLITAETTLLLLDGASATSMPSPAACTFMGLCQLFALFFFAVTFLSGVWTESPFKLNAATVVILLLTLYILDRSLTATSLRQGWGYAWQVGELALCPNNLTLSAASVAAGVLRTDLYRCCTDFSISTQCAAYTQRVSGLTPFTSSYLAFLCVGLLGLFLLFEVIARRSFGWRVHSRQQTYEKHARWLNTRTMQHRVVTLLDVFLSSIWHAYLSWWSVTAASFGWSRLWVMTAVATTALYCLSTLLLACTALGSTHRPRTAGIGLILGLIHFGLCTTALIVCVVGSGTRLLPSPDERFALQLGSASLAVRLLLLGGTAWLACRESSHVVAQQKASRRGSVVEGSDDERMPLWLHVALSQGEARALREMRAGARLMLGAHGQAPRPQYLQLSHWSLLRWSWRSGVLLQEVERITSFRHPEYRTPCIALHLNGYGVHESKRRLDLIFFDPSSYRSWMLGLQAMRRVLMAERAKAALPTELGRFVLGCFRAADGDGDGRLTAAQLVSCFARLNVLKTKEWAEGAISAAVERRTLRYRDQMSKGSKSFTQNRARITRALSSGSFSGGSSTGKAQLSTRGAPQLASTARSAIGGGSLTDLLERAGVEEEEELETLWRHAVAFSRSAAPSHGCTSSSSSADGSGGTAGGATRDDGAAAGDLLDEPAFRAALLSPDNDAFSPTEQRQVLHDMRRPLSDYFINSSHNSYVAEGTQIFGKASVDAYRRQVLMGCRCVELDCFDGKDGQPEIKHGIVGSNTAPMRPIKFRDVVGAISADGFVSSPYPITLSLEMHLSEAQQEVAVRILKEECGERLMMPDDYDALPAAMPSPVQLMGRILIKAKKRRPAPHEVWAGGKSDEEDEADGGAPGTGAAAKAKKRHHWSILHLHRRKHGKVTQPQAFASQLAARPAHMRAGSFELRSNLGLGESSTTAMASSTSSSLGDVAKLAVISATGKLTWANPKSGLVYTEALKSVTYFPSVKFKEPLPSGYPRSPYEICSIAENRVLSLSKDPELVARQIVHNATWVTRIYPDGYRQDSSNLDPSGPWACGSQMVCLNFHHWDVPMRLNFAKFRLNGMCGYILKPRHMRQEGLLSLSSNAPASLPPSPPPYSDGVSEDEMQKDMSAGYMLYRLRLCFGQQLPRPGEQRAKPEVWDRYHVPDKGASFEEKVPSATKPPSSPLCAVEVHGGGGFRCAVGEGQAYTLGATYTTRAVSLDGCAPRWDETCELVCEQPDDAILSIHVYDREPKEGSLIAYEAIPLQALRTGWRVVQLRSPTGSQLTLGSLLVHVAKESRKGAPAAHKGKRGGGGALLALGRTIGRGPATRGAKDAAPPPPQQLPGYRKASVAI